MKFLLRSALLTAIAAASIAFGSDSDPAKTLKALNKELAAAKSPQDRQMARQKVIAKAKEAVLGVDANKVEPKDGFQWAQVFRLANMPAEATTSAERFLATSPTEDRFAAQLLVIGLYIEQKQTQKALDVLRQASPSITAQTSQLASTTLRLASSGASSEESLQAISAVQKFIKLDGITDPKQRTAEESVLNTLITAKVAIYKADKKTDMVLQTIDEALKQVSPDTKFAIHFRTLRNQFTVVGTPAPELVSDRAYGSFSGIQQWKGKVIVIDFFAHWCGPCKAAFPDMEKLYADLHPKGLEIVGSSTYYGFYGDEKGITEDQEFARMEGFVKEFGIPWPVQFGNRSNFEKYGVTAIPQVVVIDKSGIVHDLHIGYSKSLFAEFRAAIEKLLAQP